VQCTIILVVFGAGKQLQTICGFATMVLLWQMNIVIGMTRFIPAMM
jgi:hypothetical protein